jgi:hypothetical protein
MCNRRAVDVGSHTGGGASSSCSRCPGPRRNRPASPALVRNHLDHGRCSLDFAQPGGSSLTMEYPRPPALLGNPRTSLLGVRLSARAVSNAGGSVCNRTTRQSRPPVSERRMNMGVWTAIGIARLARQWAQPLTTCGYGCHWGRDGNCDRGCGEDLERSRPRRRIRFSSRAHENDVEFEVMTCDTAANAFDG